MGNLNRIMHETEGGHGPPDNFLRGGRVTCAIASTDQLLSAAGSS